MKNKRKNKKVEKKDLEKKQKKQEKKGKAKKQKQKKKTKQGEESLWITVVIHSVLYVGKQKSTNIILKNKEIK
jgi:hypothetical protein